LDPFNISEIAAEATNFKFGKQIEHKKYHHKKIKIVSNGA